MGTAQPADCALGLQPTPTDQPQPLPQPRKIIGVVRTAAEGQKGGRGGHVKSLYLPRGYITFPLRVC